MQRRDIAFEDFSVRTHQLWLKQWLLLTAGDFEAGRYNTMTVGWGSFGTMWNKPFAQVVVRPGRHTFGFMEKYDTFTLTAFPETAREALKLLGSASGKDGDKIAQAHLTPEASTRIAAPAFAEADLVVECKKIYWDDMKPDQFQTPAIEKFYPENDYHRIYFGEILAISGADRYHLP